MKLLLLRCPTCQAPLRPENDDVIVSCETCLATVSIGEDGVNVVEDVQYAQPGGRGTPQVWLPMWVYYGRVNITSRKTQGSNKRALKESQAFWGEPRTLYVPAWDMSIPEARELGSELVVNQMPLRALAERPQAPLVAANISFEDARKLLEFVVLTIEAKRKDWMRSLEFSIETPPPTLWGVPASQVSPARLLLG